MAARILVFGAGAIGQWIGSRLAYTGQDVTLLVRPRQAEVINRDGVLLRENGQSHHVKSLRAATSVADLASMAAPFDWIFITVKGYDVETAVRDLRPLLGGTTRVLLFQNGLGTEGPAVGAVGGERVFICSVTKALRNPEPGVVEETNRKSGVGLAPYLPQTSTDALEAVFRASGIPHLVHPRYKDVKWSKLLLNILGNAVCAITDLSTAAVFNHRGLFHLEARAFREAVEVMRAEGCAVVALPGYPVPLLKGVMTSLPQVVLQPLMARRMAEGRGDKVPSLRLDMGKTPPRSEVRYLNGAVVAEGATAGVRTTANAFITETLTAIVDGNIDWDTYRRKPDALYQAYRRYREEARAARRL